MKGIGRILRLIEEKIRKDFLPALLELGEILDNLRRVLSHSVKHARIGIWNPAKAAKTLFLAFKNATVILTDALLNHTNLDLAEQRAQVGDAQTKARCAQVALKEAATK